MSMTDKLEALLAAGQDTVVLRFALGNAYLKESPEKAAPHLEAALAYDSEYSAAWKLLGKARASTGDTSGAIEAWRQGIAAARRKGDKQAEREMTVFLKRLTKPAQ